MSVRKFEEKMLECPVFGFGKSLGKLGKWQSHGGIFGVFFAADGEVIKVVVHPADGSNSISENKLPVPFLKT